MVSTMLNVSFLFVVVLALQMSEGLINMGDQLHQNINDGKGEEHDSNDFMLNKCDKINLVETSYGQIRSPSKGIPGVFGINHSSYPENINCAWYIKIQPESILTLSFSMFDLEEGRHVHCSQKPCCGDTWLSILNIPSHPALQPFNSSPFKMQERVSFLYCGRSLSLPPLTFSGAGLVVTFKTGDKITGGQGFVLDFTMGKQVMKQCEEGHYHCHNGKCILKSWLCNQWDECGDSSDEANCTASCKTGYSHCSSNSSHCYDFVRGRCNGVFDCPGGEDEHACSLNCGDQLPCRSVHNGGGGGCYKSGQRCDGVRDCLDGSDEEGCDSFLCGPHHSGGFLCRNRRCISFLSRCDGIQDCGDFSDEEACMKMSVITAVILGSLICGLLLIIAAGCGLRLYHLRTALERRWSTIRLQQTRSMHQDFDEFGRRRPVMGRLPPPSYAQAIGAFHLDPSSAPVSTSIPVHSHSYRHRRHSGRGPRRPAPPLPDPPALVPLRSSLVHSDPPSEPVQLPEQNIERVYGTEQIPPALSSPTVVDEGGGRGSTSVNVENVIDRDEGMWARIVHRWRKQLRPRLVSTRQTPVSQASVTVLAQLENQPDVASRSPEDYDGDDDDNIDTEPLIESQP